MKSIAASRSSEAASWRSRFYHRHVERGQRLRTDAAGLLETVAGLEAPHRRGDRLVVEIVAARLLGGQIVGDGEPLAQQRHIGASRAWHELGRSAASAGQPPRTSIAE